MGPDPVDIFLQFDGDVVGSEATRYDLSGLSFSFSYIDFPCPGCRAAPKANGKCTYKCEMY
jgi:hypothetical protein